ncbi:uncharacterized protein LOC143245563 [Tachypleus tridentatus]|uniref:uncharacterized protein LOC143245563 n=1 Tax=Tachypleus tridentatus TaxID=6853 RepID=UPI003FD3B0A4
MAAAAIGENEDKLAWHEFCDKHARLVAAELAASYRSFLNERPSVRKSVASQELSRKFAYLSQEFFDAELKRREGNSGSVDTRRLSSASNGHGIQGTPTDGPDCVKFRQPIHNASQHSDEVELSHSHYDKRTKVEKHEKPKLIKIVVESVKEGIVNYLSGDNLDGKQKWEKCRLALVKTTAAWSNVG